MTRINLVPVKSLTDKHLVAEYREMLRLRHAKIKTKTKIPKKYKMGTGHVTFFYDKGMFLIKRHEELCLEMKKRGFAVNFSLDLSSWSKERMNDWTPSQEEIEINKARICERLQDAKRNSKQ